MSISFDCHSCGRTMRAPDGSEGKRARCPSCQEVVTVPSADEPSYEAEEAAPSYSEPDDFSYSDPEPAARRGRGDDEGRRPCPMCGEMISTEAMKCRFCGEIFDSEMRAQKRRRKKHSTKDSQLDVGEIIVALLCSNIGCIMSLVWMIQGKPKGTKMLLWSLGGQVIGGIIYAILVAGKGGP